MQEHLNSQEFTRVINAGLSPELTSLHAKQQVLTYRTDLNMIIRKMNFLEVWADVHTRRAMAASALQS